MAKDNYKKTYFDYYGYDRGDWIECECGILTVYIQCLFAIFAP